MSQVIINDVPPYTQITASGGQTVFDTTWTANAPSDVVVYQTPSGDPADDATQILPYPAGYTVTFVGGLQQVRVTLVTPAGIGDIITITRQTPADRENLYSNTNFTPSMLNNDFGILTLVDQQAQLVNQLVAPRYNYSADINVTPLRDTILPILPAYSFWGMNQDGTGIEAFDIASVISGGTVTQVNTGTGLTGGPIITSGTISFAPISANSLWANISVSSGVPTVIPTSTFLISANNLSDVPNKALARSNLGLAIGTNVEAWSAALDSIASLTTVANQLIYTTALNAYSTLGPAQNSTLVTSSGNVPSFSQTLPAAVQSNITQLGAQASALNMNSHQINNVTDPTNPQDAATRAYVLAQTSGTFLPLAGGTMTGAIDMGNHQINHMADPTSSQDAVTLSYMNTALGAYLLLSGGTMTGNLNMGSHLIQGVASPVSGTDAANRAYVDSVATGFSVQPACYAATTANLTAIYVNGASGIGATLTNSGALAQFTTDGTTPPTNARILVWEQSSALQNGIYTLTNQGSGAVAWILTRATDYDQPAEIQPGDLVIINNGTAYGGSSFIETATVTAVGTDAINFSQFTFSASAVLLKANNLSDVASTTTSFNNISPLTTKGDLIGYSTQNVRLAVGGTNNQILQVNSAAATGLAWSTATYPSTTTANQILYSSSSNTVGGISTLAGGVLVTDVSSVPQFLTNPGVAGKVLQSNNGTIPSWSTPTYPSTSGTSGLFLISNGTNNVYSTSTIPTSAGSANHILLSDGTNYVLSTPTFPNASATSGKVIISDGTNWIASTPTFANSFAVSTLLYASSANTVTGLTTANSAMLVTNSTGVPAWSGTMTNGQVVIGSTSGTPAAATLTAGTNISITNASNSITIAVTGLGSASWVVETTTSRTFTAFQGVITNNAGLVTVTVPATAAVGDEFEIAGLGAGGWKVQANTGQVINFGNAATTSAGSLASTNRYDSLKFVCAVANTTFLVLSSIGNLTVA